MEVYIDILFLTNFCTDFLLLKICADILSLKFSLWRTLAASCLGGIFGLCIFVPDLSFAFSIVSVMLLGSAMIFIAFSRCKIREFLKRVAVMYAVSALFAGSVFFDIMHHGGIFKNSLFYTSTPRILLICTGIYLVLHSSVFFLKKRSSFSFPKVILEFGERKVKSTSFTDTGNNLFDPISGKPVILIEDTILKQLIDKDCRAENLYEWISSDKIRLIPYKTIDNEGVLLGIILDRLYIDGRCIENAIAAISDKSLKYPVILCAGI